MSTQDTAVNMPDNPSIVFSNRIFLIGDSHALQFSELRDRAELFFIQPMNGMAPGTPCTMFSFGNNMGVSVQESEIFQELQDGDAMIFFFGWNDVTWLIYKQIYAKNRELDEIVTTLVDNYLNTVATITDKNVIKIINNITPPRDALGDVTLSCGTPEDLLLYTQKMNDQLRLECTNRNIEFLFTHDDYCDERGFLAKDLSDGTHHISPLKHDIVFQKLQFILNNYI